jgi:cyclopropane-fatty-acyl-phospholipid synthase
MTTVTTRPGVADQLASLVAGIAGGSLPVRLRAWDGSEAGPTDGPTLVIRDRQALRRLLWSPNELGLAQAYIGGEIDVEGDLATGFRQVWQQARQRGLSGGGVRVSARSRLRAVVTAARLGVFGPKPPAPDIEAKLAGGLHTRERDRAAISYHYDLSNEFYQLILDPTMAYSCGYWTSEPSESYGVEQAQDDKLDLICRKLELRPGMRMLDVGCGWGSLTVHAARHYGVHVTGVTLSARQREFALARIASLDLGDRAEIRL